MDGRKKLETKGWGETLEKVVGIVMKGLNKIWKAQFGQKKGRGKLVTKRWGEKLEIVVVVVKCGVKKIVGSFVGNWGVIILANLHKESGNGIVGKNFLGKAINVQDHGGNLTIDLGRHKHG